LVELPEIFYRKEEFEITLFNSGYKDLNPFEFDKFLKYAEVKWGTKDFEPSKCVLIGDQLTSDIMFANLHGMRSIWVHNNNIITKCLRSRSDELFEFE
jgi:predicted HAD superfamily phosphohydrolase YqeG